MIRYSKQREAVLQVVMRTDSHPTADWVFGRVRQELPNVSLGTVYRNLGQLERAGLIRRIPDGSLQRYDGNLEPHHHFKCLQCRRIYDIQIDPQALPSQLPDHPTFMVTNMFLEIQGRCDDCQANQAEGDRHYER